MLARKMAALLLKTTATVPQDALTTASLATAAALLVQEQLVSFPTETVYGLGASALSASATEAIYHAKGRPSDNPLIVHISSLAMLHSLLPGGAAAVPPIYHPLITQFWPGPLSLIFPLSPDQHLPAPERTLAPAVTAGLPSVAIRMPQHPLALALIQLSNLPLAAPSANLSSRPSPTTAEHVQFDLGEGRGVAAILDGGECTVGVESTVVDFVQGKEGEEGSLRVLRVGGVSAEEIEACVVRAGFLTSRGEDGRSRIQVYQRDFKSSELEAKPTTPGMKYKHYAPTNSRVVLVRPVAAPSSSTSSANHLPPSLLDLITPFLLPSPPAPVPHRVGLMFTSETLATLFPSWTPTDSGSPLPSPSPSTLSLLPYPLGSASRPSEAAQRLFAGLRHFDQLPTGDGEEARGSEGVGVDLILVECLEEEDGGVGVAVMERARKAAGGSRELEFLRGPVG